MGTQKWTHDQLQKITEDARQRLADAEAAKTAAAVVNWLDTYMHPAKIDSGGTVIVELTKENAVTNGSSLAMKYLDTASKPYLAKIVEDARRLAMFDIERVL